MMAGSSISSGEQDSSPESLGAIVGSLERQVRLLEVVASTTPDFLYVFDREGRFQYANRRLLEVWGLPLHDVIDKTCRELGYEQWHHDMHMREIAQVIETKRAIKGEVPFKAPLTGVFGIYEYIFTPVLGASGEVELIAGTTRDVTARTQSEEALRASEESLRVSEARASSVALNIQDYLVLLECVRSEAGDVVDWRYVDANEKSLELLQRPREQVIGHTLREVLSERFDLVHVRMKRVLETGEAESYESKFREFAFITRLFRVDARTVGSSALDITEKRRAERVIEESASFYRQMLESIPGMVFTTRPDGYCDFHSHQWVEYTGVPLSEHLGDGWNQLLHPDDRERALVEWRAAVASTSTYDLEYRVHRHDCVYEWFRVIGRPLRDATGQVARWFGIAMNIERLKRAEASLIAAKDQLEDADRRKNEFLAVLSHELRNPLAPIANSLYILDRAPADGEQARRAKLTIDRQVTQLSNLVNDLLDVTRITRNKVQLQVERLEMNEIVRRAVEDNRSFFDNGGIALELLVAQRPVTVTADRTRLVQVVGNLLHNSAKFTSKGGRTRVSVAVEGDQAVVSVSDNGVGMDAETVGRLFQPFMQAETTLDRSKGGLGLGLALVKGLMELHGGSVVARSDGVGRGAEFTVRLPLDTELTLETTAESRTGPAPRRVLVIEDNVDAADSLHDALELAGHHVEVAYDGARGLECARVFMPEIVLCDIGLPEMDGFEVARRFRTDEALRRTHLVALSGYALPEDLKRAAEAGFERHLAKPPSLQKIEELLLSLESRGQS